VPGLIEKAAYYPNRKAASPNLGYLPTGFEQTCYTHHHLDIARAPITQAHYNYTSLTHEQNDKNWRELIRILSLNKLFALKIQMEKKNY